MLQSMELQRAGHDLAIEQKQNLSFHICKNYKTESQVYKELNKD